MIMCVDIYIYIDMGSGGSANIANKVQGLGSGGLWYPLTSYKSRANLCYLHLARWLQSLTRGC